MRIWAPLPSRLAKLRRLGRRDAGLPRANLRTEPA